MSSTDWSHACRLSESHPVYKIRSVSNVSYCHRVFCESDYHRQARSLKTGLLWLSPSGTKSQDWSLVTITVRHEVSRLVCCDYHRQARSLKTDLLWLSPSGTKSQDWSLVTITVRHEVSRLISCDYHRQARSLKTDVLWLSPSGTKSHDWSLSDICWLTVNRIRRTL
jgi:hypothetical protein